MYISNRGKGKVFYGQESPRRESTTIYCMWGKLSTTCSNATEAAQWSTPICSRLQPATNNGVRGGRSYRLTVTPDPHGQYPLSASCIV